MLALWLSLAWADPCAREVVVGRGLVPEEPGSMSVQAELDLGLKLRKRRVDGIPSWSVHKARVDWRWQASVDHKTMATSSVGTGNAVCEPESERSFSLNFGPELRERTWSYVASGLEACRVRVVLVGTVPALPTVRLHIRGPTPPGPDAPVDGVYAVQPGKDVVIDIPGCL